MSSNIERLSDAEQRAVRDIAAQHGFQTHSLSAKLEGVPGILPGAASFILHRIGLPKALLPGQRDACISPVILQNVTLPGNTQLRGIDADTPGNKPIPPALEKLRVMGVLV